MKKKVSIALIFIFVVLFNISNTNDTYAAYSISMTSSGAQSINVSPNNTGGNGTSIASDAISISTTCPSGYNLSVSTSVNDNKLYLNGSSSSNKYFSPANGSTALKNATNVWGYYINGSTVPTSNNAFSAIPAFNGTPASIKTSSNTSDSFSIYYGVSASNGLTPGTYKMIPDTNNSNADGAIIYYLTMDDSCIIIPMQEAGLNDCGRNMYDNRGTDAYKDIEYTTAEINDLCWMTRNLDLPGGTTLTSANTNLTTGFTLPASSTSGFNNMDTDFVYNSGSATCGTSQPCYSYYSFYTATAHWGTNSASSGSSSVDICPKGWRLPTESEYSTLASTYNTGTQLVVNPFLGAYSGYYNIGSFYNGGSYGYYWSSTVLNSGTAYTLYFYGNRAQTYYFYKYNGYAIRCVMKPQYTVQFDANGGSGTMANQRIYDGSGTLNANTFTKSGYYFAGWNTQADGNGTSYADRASVTNLTTAGGTITLYAQWKDAPGQCTSTETCMQTATTCNTNLTDARDGQVYSVATINGNCWMTRNLAIGCNGSGSTYGSSISSKSLTSTDSNIDATWSTPTALLSTAANSSSTSGYTTPAMQCHSSYGGYYNYAATTAGTISGLSNSTEATKDICPAGWRLPTNSETYTITFYYRYNFSPSFGGLYYSGSLIDISSSGDWWSSTASNTTNRFSLTYDDSVTPGTRDSDRYYGYSVRCIKSS